MHLRPKVMEMNPVPPTTDGAFFRWETERYLVEGAHRGARIAYPVPEKVRAGALVMFPKG
jgi:hypothetical protein